MTRVKEYRAWQPPRVPGQPTAKQSRRVALGNLRAVPIKYRPKREVVIPAPRGGYPTAAKIDKAVRGAVALGLGKATRARRKSGGGR